MSKTKDIVKRVLDDFFGVNKELGIDIVDEEDTDILSTAISDALEKEVQHENQN